jgi:uncharacterized protein
VKNVLRGHHLLCTHGFKGMGYSSGFVKVMTEIVADIRNEGADFPIQIVQGFDEACQACPHKGESRCVKGVDSHEHVLSMDERVIEHLCLQAGETYMKSDLVQRTAVKVEPDDLDRLCAGCSWLEYGVCKEGIRELKEMMGRDER